MTRIFSDNIFYASFKIIKHIKWNKCLHRTRKTSSMHSICSSIPKYLAA